MKLYLEKLRLCDICMYCILFVYFSKLRYHIQKGCQQNIILLIEAIFIMSYNFFRWSHSTNVEMVTITYFKNTESTRSIACRPLCHIFFSPISQECWVQNVSKMSGMSGI